jgi:methyl-CpG-binding domain protein 4
MHKSPFILLQEIYNEHPWRMLVCCIFLNCTTRKQVDQVREKFFEKYPEPQQLIESSLEEISSIIAPLGFKNRRAKTLVKFSNEWIQRAWKEPIELHGIGKYAQDSWEIFQKNNYEVEVTDSVLKVYLEWVKNKN